MRAPLSCLLAAALLPASALVQPALAQPAPAKLAAADEAAAFRAAGFRRLAGKWQACGDPGTPSYQAGAIDMVRDINGDGRPDAVISEGSAFCFGMTGQSFAVVSKQADGSWKLIADGVGIPEFLPRKAAAPASPGGWPEMQVGGPGFCFPVWRWNGKAYAVARHHYQGKPCRP